MSKFKSNVTVYTLLRLIRITFSQHKTNKAHFSAISATTVIDNGRVGREIINIDSLGNWVEKQLLDVRIKALFRF